MNVTLQGDFRSLLIQKDVKVTIGGQPVSLVTMEHSRLVVAVDVMILDQKLSHEIIVKTSEL